MSEAKRVIKGFNVDKSTEDQLNDLSKYELIDIILFFREQLHRYKQAIDEIEEIAKHCQQQDICTLCKNVDKCRDDYDEFSWNIANLIIQKCEEVNK